MTKQDKKIYDKTEIHSIYLVIQLKYKFALHKRDVYHSLII